MIATRARTKAIVPVDLCKLLTQVNFGFRGFAPCLYMASSMFRAMKPKAVAPTSECTLMKCLPGKPAGLLKKMAKKPTVTEITTAVCRSLWSKVRALRVSASLKECLARMECKAAGWKIKIPTHIPMTCQAKRLLPFFNVKAAMVMVSPTPCQIDIFERRVPPESQSALRRLGPPVTPAKTSAEAKRGNPGTKSKDGICILRSV
mmetsp:Transcript_48836/g.105255  ORF Transcript_48836/g.105255 Transcript_48836/m.105255 type:complete len:204 (-) Transcript_48836:153-764(-)